MKPIPIVVLLLVFIASVLIYRYSHSTTAATSLYEDESVRMEIALDNPDIQLMKEVVFTLRITQASGEPIIGADVEVILSMPEMFCGLFPATLVETSPGLYRAAAIPVMRGNWEAEAIFQVKGRSMNVKYLFKVR